MEINFVELLFSFFTAPLIGFLSALFALLGVDFPAT